MKGMEDEHNKEMIIMGQEHLNNMNYLNMMHQYRMNNNGGYNYVNNNYSNYNNNYPNNYNPYNNNLNSNISV